MKIYVILYKIKQKNLNGKKYKKEKKKRKLRNNRKERYRKERRKKRKKVRKERKIYKGFPHKKIFLWEFLKMNGGKNLKGIYSQKIFSMGITCKLNWENLHVISSQKKIIWESLVKWT